MKKHAFVVQCHTFPEQFGEIIRLMQAGNHYFFINVDKKTKNYEDFVRQAEGVENVFFLQPRVSVNHGGFSQIDCTLKLLGMAIDHPSEIDYFHSISGQDYPCVSASAFDSVFENTDHSFMHYDSDKELEDWKQLHLDRMNKWYFQDRLASRTLPVRMVKKILQMGCDLVNRRKPFGRKIYAGWSWFSWHRSVAVYVLGYLQKRPDYLKRFLSTCCADEIIFHTLLRPHCKELGVEMHNPLRYIVWKPKRPYTSLPLILEETEYDEIIESKAVFCRKIHPETSEKLIQKLRESILLEK